jgi:predicted outer membrane lipoprotein
MESLTHWLLGVPLAIALFLTIAGALPMLGMLSGVWRPTGYKHLFVAIPYLLGAFGVLAVMLQLVEGLSI